MIKENSVCVCVCEWVRGGCACSFLNVQLPLSHAQAWLSSCASYGQGIPLTNEWQLTTPGKSSNTVSRPTIGTCTYWHGLLRSAASALYICIICRLPSGDKSSYEEEKREHIFLHTYGSGSFILWCLCKEKGLLYLACGQTASAAFLYLTDTAICTVCFRVVLHQTLQSIWWNLT